MPTLLLIEDSAEDVALILSATERLLPPDQVAVLGSGEQALDYLFPAEGGPAPEAPPRLVLLDMNLSGGIAGLDVLRRIRSSANLRLVPVIVLSASVEQQDVRAATLAGANSYVRKSLDHARLAEAIRALVQYWLDLNVSPPPYAARSAAGTAIARPLS